MSSRGSDASRVCLYEVVGMPLTGSLMFVYICIDVGDPVEGRCWDAINR